MPENVGHEKQHSVQCRRSCIGLLAEFVSLYAFLTMTNFPTSINSGLTFKRFSFFVSLFGLFDAGSSNADDGCTWKQRIVQMLAFVPTSSS